jgi:hypothetical protein
MATHRSSPHRRLSVRNWAIFRVALAAGDTVAGESGGTIKRLPERAFTQPSFVSLQGKRSL